MSIGISPNRPQLDPIDLSALSGKNAHNNSLGGGSGGAQPIDLNSLFASAPPSQVNFAPPGSTEPQVGAANAAGATTPSSIVEQIMTLLAQLLQSMMQPKDQAEPGNNLASKGSGGGGGDSGGGGGGGQVGGGSPSKSSGAEAPASGAAAAVPSDTSLSGTGELHLPKELEPYRADIQSAAKASGMPANVIAGQIWAESRGQLDAGSTNVNGGKDSGLMQINAGTFEGLKKANPDLLGNADVNNAHDNILAGALYLRDQKESFGDMGSALRAYNSGPDKVTQGDPSQTGGVGSATYPADVLKFAQIIGSGDGQLPA